MEWQRTRGSAPISYLPLGEMEIQQECTVFGEMPCEITRYIGCAKYKSYGEIVEADEYHQFDNGSKYGVSRVFLRFPDSDTTENYEQRIGELNYHGTQVLRTAGP